MGFPKAPTSLTDALDILGQTVFPTG